MPYTPPSQRSPAASTTPTPTISRTHSYSKASSLPSSGPNQIFGGFAAGPRPGLPRSSSSTAYLHKHRRSPSVNKQTSADDRQAVNPIELSLKTSSLSSIRQSPPPVNDLVIPTGAVISPPDSAQNSSDDEEITKRGPSRQLDNLQELQAAISAIEQRREGSPDRTVDDVVHSLHELQNSTSGPIKIDNLPIIKPEVIKEARKISHSRSHTESTAIDLSRSKTETPDRSSDSDVEDEERIKKPPMLRKKSGELVRPALRPPSAKRRPSSMPGTPTYSKAVHFDSHLEHVRHFLQVDKPLAVSAGSSPVENFDGECEFPFSANDRSGRQPPWEWELKLSNFPREMPERRGQVVRVERVFLSADNKTLVGTVAVQNLAFQKVVVARFTFDYWKTTSEVAAEYNNDARLQLQDGCDRFNFNIRLEDQANLENRTLFFCVRYLVNGQEFWDSNNNLNFQIDFSKKALPQKGKSGMMGNASRPIISPSNSRPSPPVSSGRPRPKSTSFDDFSNGLDDEFSPYANAASIIGDKPLRFRNKRSDKIDTDASGVRTKASSQAFGNRYDFGASLSAAIQAASSALGDRSGLQFKKESPRAFGNAKPPTEVSSTRGDSPGANSKPTALTSEKPALQSQSYHELIDKYCFFGSAKSSPPSVKPGNGNDKEVEDNESVSDCNLSRNSSFENSPIATPAEKPNRTIIPPATHTIRPAVPSPTSVMAPRTASPVSFGYPFHQPMQGGFFNEGHTPTAIRG